MRTRRRAVKSARFFTARRTPAKSGVPEALGPVRAGTGAAAPGLCGRPGVSVRGAPCFRFRETEAKTKRKKGSKK